MDDSSRNLKKSDAFLSKLYRHRHISSQLTDRKAVFLEVEPGSLKGNHLAGLIGGDGSGTFYHRE